MPCEHYKEALIEVAASGVVLADAPASDAQMGALREHLDACASCRAAFDEEQSLFAGIGSGLHFAANTEVPPSLIPRVRARLDESALKSPRWGLSWFALAGTAIAAAAFFLVVTTRQRNPQPATTNLVANRTSAPQFLPATQGVSPSTLPKKKNSGQRPAAFTTGDSAQPAELASHKPTPEILVPRDQEILLASYAQQWDSRKHPSVLAGEVDQNPPALLEISPIRIPELDVKPLAEGDSQ